MGSEMCIRDRLSLVLLFDLKLNLPSWGQQVLRLIGIITVSLSLSGFAFLIKQHLQFAGSANLKLILVEQYLFQTAYLFISLIVLGKSYEAKWSNMNYAGKYDA